MSTPDEGVGLQVAADEDITLGQDRFHTLTLIYDGEPSGEDLDWVDEYRALIFCPGNHAGDKCAECRDLDTPPFGDDSWRGDDLDRQIHGEWHIWSDEDGWTLPYAGCPVGEADYRESAVGIMGARGPGTYLVEVEWEDDDPWLVAVGRDGSPLSDPDEPWSE
jgi:hypothetical protein